MQGNPISSVDASWFGGLFDGDRGASSVDWTGTVFDLVGSRIRLEGIRVADYKDGKAFNLNGDDILLRDVRVENLKRQDSGGIVFTGGDNFRCENTTVVVGGAAVSLAPASGATVTNASCIGLAASSTSGGALVLDAQGGGIDTVRVDGLAATGGSAGNIILIRNQGTAAVRNVSIRNAAATCGSSTSAAVLIHNVSTGTLGSIVLDNVTVLIPAGTTSSSALNINSTQGVAVDSVRWSSGGVRPLTGGSAIMASQYITLRGANNIQLSGLRLDGSTSGSPIVIGNGVDCRAVILADVAITRIAGSSSPTSTVAVSFMKAVNCGMIRGIVSGTANAFAARFTADADGCYIEDVDLSGLVNTTDGVIDILTGKPYRLTNNAVSSSTPPQRSPVELGPQITIALTSSGQISTRFGFVELNPDAGVTTLSNILTSPSGKSLPGDLIVLSVKSGKTVTVSNGTGNIHLATTPGTILLGITALRWHSLRCQFTKCTK